MQVLEDGAVVVKDRRFRAETSGERQEEAGRVLTLT